MDNKETIKRLDDIDAQLLNVRDRLAIAHAVTILERVERLEVFRKDDNKRIHVNTEAEICEKILHYLRTGEEW